MHFGVCTFNLTNFCIWLFNITTVIQTLSFIHVQATTIISLTTMQVTNDSLTYIFSYFCNDVYLISLNRGLFWNTSDTLNVVTKKNMEIIDEHIIFALKK